jgi:transcriptional regulator with XRE-family HTH domain
MIAENIKKIRKKKGISQDKLSKLADVTLTTLTKIESGINTNPTVNTIQKIAKALDIGVEDLLKT